MKFGKNLAQVVEFSDPEWGPYWMNYKFLKKKINDITIEHSGSKASNPSEIASNPSTLSKSNAEVEFFRLLKSELRKTNDFFKAEEGLFRIRRSRVWEGFNLLKDQSHFSDKTSWTRLSMACVKFYEDVLLLENFAIMNYCGFSKILKKHDKLTGFNTREAFMRITMEQQAFTHHFSVIQMLKESEDLFVNIQSMKSALPLKEEEKLFIEAIRDLNYQASRVRAAETECVSGASVSPCSETEANSALTIASTLFPHSTISCEENVHRDTVGTGNTASYLAPPIGSSLMVSAEEGLHAATLALTAVAKNTYLRQSLPNLCSAISWINNVSGDPSQGGESSGGGSSTNTIRSKTVRSVSLSESDSTSPPEPVKLSDNSDREHRLRTRSSSVASSEELPAKRLRGVFV